MQGAGGTHRRGIRGQTEFGTCSFGASESRMFPTSEVCRVLLRHVEILDGVLVMTGYQQIQLWVRDRGRGHVASGRGEFTT
jgi:hypothetical protein